MTDMQKELSESTAWLALQLVKAEADRAAFAMELSLLLEARFTGHWYPDEPHRGCAFRAIACDGQAVDPLLKRAAVAAGVSCSLPSPDSEFTLWINPGEVKALSGGVTHKVFTSGEQNSNNPYLKPRVKLERTKILCAASSRRTTASSDGSLSPSTASRSQSPPLSPSGTHAPSPPASPTLTKLSPAANEFTMPPPTTPAMPPGLFVPNQQHWQMQMQEQLWAAQAYGVAVY